MKITEMMTKTDSSMVASVGWASNKLYVEFKSGKVYSYEGVAFDVYARMLAAESKGRFFNSEIRDRYACSEVAAQ